MALRFRGIPLRSIVAVRVGRAVAALSRLFGRGEGMVIGGQVMRRISPSVLPDLANDRVAALVSATNGKTSTTRLLAMAMAESGPVVTQRTGANMTDGVVEALSHGGRGAPAILEVDEAYLPMITEATHPKALLLGNLTRDQLDRMNEVGKLARKWRTMLAEIDPGQTTVVANCDDPIVVFSAIDFANVIWVAGGQSWTADAGVCLNCGALIRFEDGDWACTGCALRRPTPAWSLAGNEPYRAVGPQGEYDLSEIQLPGRFNAANAVMALAVAAGALGQDPRAVVRGMAKVQAVSGRYEVREIGALKVRLLLAKNPASWSETLTVMPPAPTPVIVTINSNDADGHDPSWLWDVPFEKLLGRLVVATGDRRRDLAVRLMHAGVDHVVIEDPYDPATELPDVVRQTPILDCAATYTAFHGLRTRADARTDAKRRKGKAARV